MNFPKIKERLEGFFCYVRCRFGVIVQSSHSAFKDLIGEMGIIDLSEINYNALRKEIEDLNPELVGHVPAFGSSAFLYKMNGSIYLDVGKGNHIQVNGVSIEDEQFVLLPKGVPVRIGGLVLIFEELVK